MFKVFMICILLTPEWNLVKSPVEVQLASMDECERLARQREFQPPPGNNLASFYLCELR